jgi:hypothetical protein
MQNVKIELQLKSLGGILRRVGNRCKPNGEPGGRENFQHLQETPAAAKQKPHFSPQ